jgi:ribosomal-protein-serine acetyltransferase
MDWPNRSTAIGYWLAEPLQGRGIMTAACRAMVANAFGDLGLNRVEIRCATTNARSRVIPMRLGFGLEGVCRQVEWLYDHFVDHEIWAMLAEHWKAG